ncbi:MAG: tRNA (pseudouridine(54)-N(1))-methyltransferase TrmY [Euryarchaeota archaeon]|nr:tRNA (pseudouridine(54)-N(1))-methyltransferase TrmY [Euryarchaeota archaeon]
MVTFIVKSNTAKANFLLKDLPGSGRRVDILCRCINSAFCLSHDIRRDVTLHLCFAGKTLKFVGSELKHLTPDERGIAILIRKALDGSPTPGVYVSEQSFEDLVAMHEGRVVYLNEHGEDIATVPLNSEMCFVLAGHKGFNEGDQAFLEKIGQKVSLSPKILHVDHCIIIAHNFLDRA